MWLTGPALPRALGGKGHPEQWTALGAAARHWKGLLVFSAGLFIWLVQRRPAHGSARGIFMEEVHASNSLSSSKLAAPAQKDLGAVNNSVWLRDFHFAGPCSPIPQGLARGWPPIPPLASWLLPAALARGSVPVPPALPPPALCAQPCPPCFSCSLPASFLSISLFFVCRLPRPPRPSLPCSISSALLSASLIHWLPSATAEAELLCCWLLCLGWTVGKRCLQGSLPAQGRQPLAAGPGCGTLPPSPAPLQLWRASPHPSDHRVHGRQPLLCCACTALVLLTLG